MRYLYWYLGVGVFVIFLFMIINRLINDTSQSTTLIPEPNKPVWQKVIENTLLPLLFSPFWPLLVVLRVKEFFSKKEEPTMIEEKEFAVEPVHLKEKISINEIEQRERVVDPLGAVPDLPFGHLYHAWQKLVSQMEENDTIWTFETIWTTWYGSKELMIGYAVKKGEGVGAHLLTLCKRLD